MRILFSHFLVACAGLATHASCFAYDCNDSDLYQNGQHELALLRQTNSAQLARAVEFVQKAKGADFNAALQEVMQTAGSPSQTRIYDDQLNELGAKIKEAKHDSPQACEELLKLQRQHAHVGQEKIGFIVKLVTGEDSAAR